MSWPTGSHPLAGRRALRKRLILPDADDVDRYGVGLPDDSEPDPDERQANPAPWVDTDAWDRADARAWDMYDERHVFAGVDFGRRSPAAVWSSRLRANGQLVTISTADPGA